MKLGRFLTTLGIGALAGMLLAPKKGSELRISHPHFTPSYFHHYSYQYFSIFYLASRRVPFHTAYSSPFSSVAVNIASQYGFDGGFGVVYT